MASEEAKCLLCGKPLSGRERFEGKCAACREAEVLAQALPEKAPEPLADAAAQPPAPTSRRRAHIVVAAALLILAAAAVGLVATLVLRWQRDPRAPQVEDAAVVPKAGPAKPESFPTPPPTPSLPKPAPEDLAAALRQETRELLTLLASGNYERVIDNYVQPDEAEFRRLERALDDIVKGAAAQGFAAWTARRIRLREAAVAKNLAGAGDPQPDFTLALLSHLAREPAASDARASSEDRARAIARWHLASLFDGLHIAATGLGAITEPQPGHYDVGLIAPGQRRARWLANEPLRIRWARLPVGWVVELGLAERIERARDTLKQPVPEEPPAPP